MGLPSNKIEESAKEDLDSSEPESRKVSDIIISLENKLDLLLKYTVSQDTNFKLLLGRLNKISSILENIDNKAGAILPQGLEDNSAAIENIDSVAPISIETSPVGIRRIARPETYEDVSRNKVVPVQQKVFDPLGKSVFMAEVEILDSNKNLVSKLRTTAAGKWQLPLNPGHYFVSILKRESGSRKRMEYSGEFDVKESDKPLDIEPAKLSM